MAVTRSQRPKGSPTKSKPAVVKESQKSKAKADKTTTKATWSKPAKVQKSKSEEGKSSKPFPKATFKTSTKAAKKPASKKALRAKALTDAKGWRPEATEDLGLAYVDLPTFGIPGFSRRQLGTRRDYPHASSIDWGKYLTADPSSGRVVAKTPTAAPRRPMPGFASDGADKLSPRGVRAGEHLLRAVESPFSGLIPGESTGQVFPANPLMKNKRKAVDSAKSPNSVAQDIARLVEAQTPSSPPRGSSIFGKIGIERPNDINEHFPGAPPRGGFFGRQPSERHCNANANANTEAEAEDEDEDLDSPVSVNNAQVFKRPTVADLRSERSQMVELMGGWVRGLKRARVEFEDVIGDIEDRMRILKAVNRMQGPLRKAPLGRGH